MPPIRPFDTPPAPDIPVLEDIITQGDGNPVPPKPKISAPVAQTPAIQQAILNDMLTERLAALTDRLLREASADIQDLLMDKIWEKLRQEIPIIVAAALKENGHGG
ncbi:MAG: hypothetical protein ACRER0_03805 [Gammaproteobacteria bacterium]